MSKGGTFLLANTCEGGATIWRAEERGVFRAGRVALEGVLVDVNTLSISGHGVLQCLRPACAKIRDAGSGPDLPGP